MIISNLLRQDHKKAINAAIEGMHFDRYIPNAVVRSLYGRYFWYSELLKATRVIAAYHDDEFAGVLLARVDGEKPVYNSWSKRVFVGFFEFIQKIFADESAGEFDRACQHLYSDAIKSMKFDAEICFLAANPNVRVKGVGTFLLGELTRVLAGKQIFLFTDSGCTYQFYEHRGFTLVAETTIALETNHENIPLRCMLYTKML
ncbi:GNAT family N-acetyltransferase [Alloscardovia theropitheci]|uniref:GNAT family N-acetyltransferase n=1 Tax=Alloscardovia theropitheci TaxID=2496842 RepID=A0A4R0R0L6_9BIFI|nr:GNAT family N-acetyltransferase [Alloscardovia theropitheci]TCD54596.1 GNAT family N-acetyltransferase [Alloscardovia theropitheci]